MFNYEKRLEYPIHIKETNPKLAKAIITQYGGPYTGKLQLLFSKFCSVNANKVLEVYTIHTSELLAIKTKNLIIITGKLIIKYEIASNNGWLFNIVDNAELFSDSNMQVVYLPKYSGGYAQVAFKKTLDNNSKNVLQCTTAYSGDPITAGEEVIVNIVFATKS